MRPIRLTVQAFGAYVQDKSGKAIVIDFAKLGKKGLFLVTGDTGAGKTTIFDAITYALFGKTSGESRDGSMMRSTYAPNDVPTFVELEFEYDGKTHTVRRAPAQSRPKERGEGMTNVNETACLTIEGEVPATNIKEVNRKLIDLLGVTFEQYSQISMIAQGKFRDLLDADTKKRAEIFRSIFKTGNFLTLQQNLKEQASALYAQVSNERRRVVQFVEGAACRETSPMATTLSEAKEKVKNGGMPIADARQLIQDILDSDLAEQVTNRKELEAVDNELKIIATNLQTLQTYTGNIRSLAGKNAEKLQKETEVRPVLEKAKADADARKADIDRLNSEIAQMGLVMENYGKLTSCSNDIAKNSRQYDSTISKRNLETNEKERLNAKIRTDEAELTGIKDPASEIATLNARQNAIVESKGRIDGIGKAYQNYSADCGKLPGLKNDVQKKEREWSDKNGEYNEKHRLFIAEQAGYLAQELEEGRPCPVCGSTHHPTLARKTPAAPTKEQLEALFKEVGSLKTAAEKAAAEFSNKSGAVDAARQSLLENANTVFSKEVTIDSLPVELDSIVMALDTEYEDNRKRLTELAALNNRKKVLEESLPKDRTKLQEHAENEAACNTSIGKLQAEGNALKERLEDLKKGLAYDSEASAKEALKAKEAEKKKLEKAISDADQALQEYGKVIATLEGSIRQLKELTAIAPAVDEASAIARKAELNEKKTGLETVRDILVANISKNQYAIGHIDSTSGNLAALEEEYRWKNTLAQTANGELSGKDKISLETYVQMAFFDRILQRANTRLMVMSGGQYELRRSGEFSGRAQAGLNLDVLDHYNGTTRSVKSLSGGESFKAALSLALGLSDEIQASAGGIKLDTMFVDEGFGSLDEESLQQALKALNALTEGDRLIGIISHVAELKKIDKQIVVTKDKLNFSQVDVLS